MIVIIRLLGGQVGFISRADTGDRHRTSAHLILAFLAVTSLLLSAI